MKKILAMVVMIIMIMVMVAPAEAAVTAKQEVKETAEEMVWTQSVPCHMAGGIVLLNDNGVYILPEDMIPEDYKWGEMMSILIIPEKEYSYEGEFKYKRAKSIQAHVYFRGLFD